MVVNPHPQGGLIYFYEDVSDRLALERTRNLQIAVQKATLDNLREGVAVFGGDGRLTLFNPRYAEMWRLDEAFLATRPHVSDIAERWRVLMDGSANWEELREHMLMGALERAGSVQRIERPDGVVIDHASVPLPDGAVLTACIDITDSIRIERALRDRNEALEAADVLKSKFLESVSYTLRTPLNTIMGFDELLMRPYFGELNSRQREYAEGILESSRQLLVLIDDILDLASIEAGRMELRKTSIDLRDMLAGIVRQTRARVARRGITLAVECDRDIGSLIADGRRIAEVLGDLINNAVAFTPPEGAVAIGARREGDDVILWVADTGGAVDADPGR
jgi:signal transduction histidine kinase